MYYIREVGPNSFSLAVAINIRDRSDPSKLCTARAPSLFFLRRGTIVPARRKEEVILYYRCIIYLFFK